MLADENEEIRNNAIMQLQTVRETKSTRDSCGESEEPSTTLSTSDSSIRRFLIPSVIFEATCYNKIINGLFASTKEPPLTQNIFDSDIAKIHHSPMVLFASLPQPGSEASLKAVIETLAVVCGMEQRC